MPFWLETAVPVQETSHQRIPRTSVLQYRTQRSACWSLENWRKFLWKLHLKATSVVKLHFVRSNVWVFNFQKKFLLSFCDKSVELNPKRELKNEANLVWGFPASLNIVQYMLQIHSFTSGVTWSWFVRGVWKLAAVSTVFQLQRTHLW